MRSGCDLVKVLQIPQKPSRGLATLRVKIWCDRAATLSKCCRYHTKTEQGFSNFTCQNLVRWGCDAVNVLFIPHEKTEQGNSYPKRQIASPVPLKILAETRIPKDKSQAPSPLRVWKKFVSQKTNRKPRPPKSLEEIRIPKDKSQAPSALRFWQKRISQKSNRKPRLPQEFGRNSYPKRQIASPVPLRVWKKFVSQKTNRKPRPPKSLEEIRISKDKSQAPTPLRFWQKRVSQKTNRKPRPP